MTTFTITGHSIDDFADFTSDTMSVGGNKGTFTVAAHIQKSTFIVPAGNGGPFMPDSDFVGVNPIPEPTSAVLFAVGLLVVGGAMRNKIG